MEVNTTLSSTSKVILAVVLTAIVSGCTSLTGGTRPTYEGSDQVGAVDISQLVGTWQSETLNPRETDPPIEQRFTISADGAISGIATADLTEKDLDLVVYDVTGTWVVDGEFINQTIVSAEQVSGTPFAAFGVSLSMGLFEGRTIPNNVYEISEDQLILVDELDVARRFTRVSQ